MSIESLRKFIEKYGVPVFALMFIAFSLSFVTQGGQCGRLKSMGDQQANSGVIATLDDFSSNAAEVENIVAPQRSTSTTPFGPEEEAMAYAGATDNVINHLLELALAASKGINMDDNAVQEAIPSLWAQQVDTFKGALERDGKIKPNATEKEFEDAFKVSQYSNGMTLDEAKDFFTKQFNTAYSDPSKTDLMKAEIAFQQLNQKYNALSSVSDSEVQNSFGDYKVLVIEFDGKTGQAGIDEANKAIADIKGGMKFEDAMKKYSNAKPLPGKSASDPQDISSFFLQNIPTYKVLLDLKEGDISAPIDSGVGTAIYKVVKFTPSVPPDFATKKDQVRKQMQSAAAQQMSTQDLDNLRKSGKLVWKSLSYKALYDFREGSMGEPTQVTQNVKAAEAEAQAAMTSDPDNARIAALAFFITNKNLWDAAKPDEQKAMAADRIKAIESVLNFTESPDLRLQLADLYLAAGRTDDAVAMIVAAAQSNNGVGTDTVKNYETIMARVDKLKAQDKIKPDAVKTIDDSLDQWRLGMQQDQQQKADAEKQEAADAAAAKVQAAKDAAAAKAAAKKAPVKPAATTTPAPGTTTPPATTPPVTTPPVKPTTTTGK